MQHLQACALVVWLQWGSHDREAACNLLTVFQPAAQSVVAERVAYIVRSRALCWPVIVWAFAGMPSKDSEQIAAISDRPFWFDLPTWGPLFPPELSGREDMCWHLVDTAEAGSQDCGLSPRVQCAWPGHQQSMYATAFPKPLPQKHVYMSTVYMQRLLTLDCATGSPMEVFELFRTAQPKAKKGRSSNASAASWFAGLFLIDHCAAAGWQLSTCNHCHCNKRRMHDGQCRRNNHEDPLKQ
eukprot:361855-Chlamydomonas_euryale.AAC.5